MVLREISRNGGRDAIGRCGRSCEPRRCESARNNGNSWPTRHWGAAVRESLRQSRIARRARSHVAGTRGQIKDMVLISERPPEVTDRAVPGFWEADLIIVKEQASQIATPAERTTRYVTLARIPTDRTAERGRR